MIRRPPDSTRTYARYPYTTLVRSHGVARRADRDRGRSGRLGAVPARRAGVPRGGAARGDPGGRRHCLSPIADALRHRSGGRPCREGYSRRPRSGGGGPWIAGSERKSVGEGKRGATRGDLGGPRSLKKKKK